MKQVTFIAPTKRRRMTKARRTRIFLANNGVCHVCKTQIRDGEAWDVEHPDALSLGGSDKDEDLRPVHAGKRDCHKKKTAGDRQQIAARNRVIDTGYRGKEKRSGFRGWRKFDGTIVYNARSDTKEEQDG